MIGADEGMQMNKDERHKSLVKRLDDYYADVEFSNRSNALIHLKAFKRWCADRSYTAEEISKAKKEIKNLNEAGESNEHF